MKIKNAQTIISCFTWMSVYHSSEKLEASEKSFLYFPIVKTYFSERKKVQSFIKKRQKIFMLPHLKGQCCFSCPFFLFFI